MVDYEDVLGYEVPFGTFPCWMIEEDSRHKALKEKKPFNEYRPDCYFKVTKQLDNNFLEGHLGHRTFEGQFHAGITTSYTYFENYQKREPVYFSFDRVSLYKLITIHPTKPLTFILKRLDSQKATIANKVFMIMPFKYKSLNQFYQTNIREFLLKELQIQVFRADDFSGNDIIIETIYNQIEESEFIIVDSTHSNKNAFLEFGYAIAKDKEIIMIQNNDLKETLFFDRAHIRAILYSHKNIPDFQRQLTNTIRAIRDKVSSKN